MYRCTKHSNSETKIELRLKVRYTHHKPNFLRWLSCNNRLRMLSNKLFKRFINYMYNYLCTTHLSKLALI